MISLAALMEVMFMVVFRAFKWTSFRILHKIPRADAFVLILVSGVMVFTDIYYISDSGKVNYRDLRLIQRV
jgi:SulP family sulfate permease